MTFLPCLVYLFSIQSIKTIITEVLLLQRGKLQGTIIISLNHVFSKVWHPGVYNIAYHTDVQNHPAQVYDYDMSCLYRKTEPEITQHLGHKSRNVACKIYEPSPMVLQQFRMARSINIRSMTFNLPGSPEDTVNFGVGLTTTQQANLHAGRCTDARKVRIFTK